MAPPLDAEAVAFIQLKVACNQVMEAPSIASVERLSNLTKNLPLPAVQNVHEHVLFVLMQFLQQKQTRLIFQFFL